MESGGRRSCTRRTEAAAAVNGAAAAAAARARRLVDAFWNRSHIHVWAGANATNTTAAALRNLTARYAQTRYLQAIQAGTWVPVLVQRPAVDRPAAA